MDELEITVFDEIKDYKEKIYFLNFRQWIFAILIVGLVVPTYLLLKDRIGEEITSYIIITIAGVLGFIGFVKIHELPAEKILPFWFRHYFLFAKPIHYMTDAEFEKLHQKKRKNKVSKTNLKESKLKINGLKRKQKQEKLLEEAKKKDKVKEETPKQENKKEELKATKNKEDELTKKLSKLSKEQQDALLKLLER